MGRLDGKVAIITGAGCGIGKATALLFAREGAKVVVTDVNVKDGLDVLDEIQSSNHDGLFVKLDVSSESDWENVVTKTLKTFGKIDVLYNNAGIYIIEPLATIKLETWNKLMSINVAGTFLGLKHVLPVMAGAGGGSVVNCSSLSALVGGAGHAMYGASKGAVRTLTKHAAVEYIRKNVRVNSIYPGYTETGMASYAAGRFGIDQQSLGTAVPMGRLGHPIDMARLVVFLASDESAYCTGAEFVADGGISLSGATGVGATVHAAQPK